MSLGLLLNDSVYTLFANDICFYRSEHHSLLTSQLNDLNEKNTELEQQIGALTISRDSLIAQISEAKKKNNSMSITLKSIQAAIVQLKKDEVNEASTAKESLEFLQQKCTAFDDTVKKISSNAGL